MQVLCSCEAAECSQWCFWSLNLTQLINPTFRVVEKYRWCRRLCIALQPVLMSFRGILLASLPKIPRRFGVCTCILLGLFWLLWLLRGPKRLGKKNVEASNLQPNLFRSLELISDVVQDYLAHLVIDHQTDKTTFKQIKKCPLGFKRNRIETSAWTT